MRLPLRDVLVRAWQRGYSVDEIRPCLTADLGDGVFEVNVDHPDYPRTQRDGHRPAMRMRDFVAAGVAEIGESVAKAEPEIVQQGGPGTELKALLKGWLGIEATPTCSCNRMAKKMDSQPIEWSESEEGMAEILDVMRGEHAKRWKAGQTILPWTDIGARQLVLMACRRARGE